MYEITPAEKHLFGGNREKAIQRDGEKCVQCGMTRQYHRFRYNRDITVDHIDNNGINKPTHLKNNSLDNLQTLCVRCHNRKDNTYKKLTPMQVINIRHIGGTISQRKLAKLYGISQTTVCHVVSRKVSNYTDNELAYRLGLK